MPSVGAHNTACPGLVQQSVESMQGSEGKISNYELGGYTGLACQYSTTDDVASVSSKMDEEIMEIYLLEHNMLEPWDHEHRYHLV